MVGFPGVFIIISYHVKMKRLICMYNDKTSFRKQALAQRDLLSKKEVIVNSAAIIERLKNTDLFINSKVIMSYVNFKNEVITYDFIKYCIENGKTVATPAIINSGGNSRIEAFVIKDISTDLKLSNFGILEPFNILDKIDSEEIDLSIVPGIAFDILKNRLGFGAGFYDKFLCNCSSSNMIKIGLSYEMQVYEKIPTEKYDICMDFVITEARII